VVPRHRGLTAEDPVSRLNIYRPFDEQEAASTDMYERTVKVLGSGICRFPPGGTAVGQYTMLQTGRSRVRDQIRALSLRVPPDAGFEPRFERM
jgi:hypothetical protein